MMRLVAIAILVAACSAAPPAAVVTPAPIVTPEPPLPTSAPVGGSGLITFGDRYDKDTLRVNPSKTRFKAGDRKIAWSAELTGPAGALSLTWLIASRRASGVESTVFRDKLTVANPEFDLFGGAEDIGAYVGRKPGTYVLRLLRGSTVLAEGEFTLVR